MELDERFMGMIFEYIKPTHLMITNITRDQPQEIHIQKIYLIVLNHQYQQEQT